MKQEIYILRRNIHQKPFDGDITLELEKPKPAPLDYSVLQEIARNAQDKHNGLIFASYSDPFDAIDYPDNHNMLHILSSRAVEIIKSNFTNHQCEFLKITVIDGLLSDDDPRERLEEMSEIIEISLRDKRFYTEEYFIVIPPLIKGIFDFQNSQYGDSACGRVGFVDKYVINTGEIDLPPLFSLQECPGPVFINCALRNLWKKHRINGTLYTDLDKSYKSYQIDIEVPNPNIPE